MDTMLRNQAAAGTRTKQYEADVSVFIFILFTRKVVFHLMTVNLSIFAVGWNVDWHREAGKGSVAEEAYS